MTVTDSFNRKKRNFAPRTAFYGEEPSFFTASSGFSGYGARYLEGKTGRWLSADPAMGEYIPSPGQDTAKLPGLGGIYNTVNLHVYHYAGNNPVKYTDPDGEAFNFAIGALGAVAGGLVAAVVSIQAGNDIKDTLINVGVGMVGGAAAGIALSVGQGAVAGAAIGAVSNIIVQRTTGSGDVEPLQVLAAAGIGALGGTIGTAMGNSVAASLASPSMGISTAAAAEVGSLVNTAVTTMAAGIAGAVTSLMDMNK